MIDEYVNKLGSAIYNIYDFYSDEARIDSWMNIIQTDPIGLLSKILRELSMNSNINNTTYKHKYCNNCKKYNIVINIATRTL